MNWLFSIVRIAGASSPFTSWLVQIQSEIDSKALNKRNSKLEDPISHLHDDVPELSRQIYQKLKLVNSNKLDFNEKLYKKYNRALAILESQGYIICRHNLGKKYAKGIHLVHPSYIIYLCALEEDSKKMESLIEAVDNCKPGQWLDGNKIHVDLPLPVIKVVFDIYESKGYGLCSREIGSCKYMGKV